MILIRKSKIKLVKQLYAHIEANTRTLVEFRHRRRHIRDNHRLLLHPNLHREHLACFAACYTPNKSREFQIEFVKTRI